jgi:hypothetical protein
VSLSNHAVAGKNISANVPYIYRQTAQKIALKRAKWAEFLDSGAVTKYKSFGFNGYSLALAISLGEWPYYEP